MEMTACPYKSVIMRFHVNDQKAIPFGFCVSLHHGKNDQPGVHWKAS